MTGKWITEDDLRKAMYDQRAAEAFPGDLIAFSEREVADLWFRLPTAINVEMIASALMDPLVGPLVQNILTEQQNGRSS